MSRRRNRGFRSNLSRSGRRREGLESARLGPSLGSLFEPVNGDPALRWKGGRLRTISLAPDLCCGRCIGARTSMTTNYDPIAEQYKRSKQHPWRAHVEAFTLMTLIGDPAGKAVIDFAC